MTSASTSNGTSKGRIGLRWRAVLALFVGLIFDSPLAWAAGKAFPPMRDEDSPRDYIVRQVPGDVEVVYFNDYGQACATRVSELRGRVW